MPDQSPEHFDPTTAHILASTAFARKVGYLGDRGSGFTNQTGDIRLPAEEPARRNPVLTYQSSQAANMDYMQQNAFAFASQPQSQFIYPQVQYQAFMTHAQQPVDDFYMPYGGAEYADFADAGMMQDEFGENQEISTRPRLTKEQAEILEAHFQANHKPSSQLKRELAIQTNLKLNRVGNWFQNRRAKAKQQKRQEEYEAQHAATKPGSKEPKDLVLAEISRREIISPRSSVASPTKESSTNSAAASVSTAQTSPSPVKVVENPKEASWNSLQRALGQAKAAQGQQVTQPQATAMSSLEIPPQTASMQLPIRLNDSHTASSTSSLPTWPNRTAGTVPYPSPITFQDTSFDFGFGDEVAEQTPSQDPTTIDPVADYGQESFVVTPEDYRESLATPKGMHSHQSPMTALPSPGLTMPSYPGSRRPSTTEDLSTNFSHFALASDAPNMLPDQRVSEGICPPQSGPLDIAARRKRPRPAALTSASLRSRSYGAMTSASPTFRQGIMSPQAPHGVRHVKSAGQSLHSRYAGIRKASSAQRSPMCASTFAEAEALNQLMAQQAMTTTPLGELAEPLLSPDHMPSGYVIDPEKNPFFAQAIDMSNQYSMRPPQNLAIAAASPPVTPMMAAFMSRAQSQQSLIPPASAPPQYAAFTDYTPPYSAGPLTNSSWSDCPLTSPEIPSFPVTHIASLGFPNQCDGLSGQFQQFVLPSDNKSEVDFVSHVEQKKTEFYIQEFPNQKEEHAHVAQQLAQQKPKNYVFANTAPQDYTGT
ncbi:Homeobox domain-containing protein [Cladophialophora immunda]|nr:Homeobox domain-containing protein [Cladophialophora immunda]